MTSRLVLMVGMAVSVILASSVGMTRATQETSMCATPAAGEVQRFTGSNSTVTVPFELPNGVYVVTGRYNGEEDFIVDAVDEAGNKKNVIDEIGVYKGEATLRVQTDTSFVLDITAKAGDWDIGIRPAFRS